MSDTSGSVFAEKLSNITPYPVDISKYKVRLDANESYIPLGQNILNEFTAALRTVDFIRYPDPQASELCGAFNDFYGIDGSFTCAGNGSDEIISVLMNGFVDKGETVMTFAPDFSMYAFYASLAELKTVVCEKDPKTLQVNFEAADKLIAEKKVRLCIFSNPCNPTGRIEKRSDIEYLVKKHPTTLFVIDEAYMDFAGSAALSESFLSFAGKYPNAVVLKTLSKAIGAAALRLGFIVSDKAFYDMFCEVKSPYNVNSVSQAFGKALLREKELLKECTKKIVRSKDELYSGICELVSDKPEDTYTNFVYYRTPNAVAIYEQLKQKGILVRCFGSQYGGAALRITAGTPDENRRVLAALKYNI